ncbi:MAG: sigma-70 family RNA polymerase sigma factor [Bacteroidales bacterium]|nr:sigma-70 family RNA polymerase sigma factor [Bacteroidales bacterium]MCF8456920.1 sigma-70 family RNA polymerase sigma factor [Bacteroidales bacterium]
MIKSKVLSNIRNGDEEELGNLYLNYKEEFVKYARKNFKVDVETAKDLFTDLLLEFRSNVVSGKLQNIESSIKTYLFGIGRNLLIQHIKKKPDEDISNYKDKLSEEDVEISQTEQSEILLGLIENHLPKRCYKLLKLYYYDHRSMKQIQSWLNYSSLDSVRNQKSKCMSQLKSMIKLVEVQYKLFN